MMYDIDALDPHTHVLVVIICRLRDLVAARDEGWYRVPLARAPRALHAEFLAFYQTAAFGSERWSVRYIAPVRKVSLATRIELLPDEPTHPRAHDRYYRFGLGRLQPLPLPVPSRRVRRLSFIATTLGQLLCADDLVDLWRPSTAADQNWAELWGAGVNQRG